MRKLMIAALLCALAVSAQAVTFTWGATKVAFDGSQLKSSTAVTGYLIYLGNNSLASTYTLSADSTVDSVVASIGTQVNSKNKTSAVAKLAGEWDFNYSDGYENNKGNFAMLLVYQGDKTYYNLTSGTLTLQGGNDADIENAIAAVNPSDGTFSFSYATAGESKTLSKGGGWTVAVPEPSTAMLALAGLALLIKRRRA